MQNEKNAHRSTPDRVEGLSNNHGPTSSNFLTFWTHFAGAWKGPGVHNSSPGKVHNSPPGNPFATCAKLRTSKASKSNVCQPSVEMPASTQVCSDQGIAGAQCESATCTRSLVHVVFLRGKPTHLALPIARGPTKRNASSVKDQRKTPNCHQHPL